MDLLPPVGWGDVARQSDITALRTELRGELAELRGEMAMLRAELTSELRRVDGRIDGLLPRLVAANIASMIGVATLVLATTQLT